MKKILFMCMMIGLLSAECYCLEIGGAVLPDSMTVDGKQLVLNGAGIRKKLFIKVYAGGLYLPAKEKNPKTIIDADLPMAIRLHFLYDVSNDKLIGAWNEGFMNSTGGNIEPLKTQIDTFNSYFTEEAKKDDVYDIVYLPGKGVKVVIKDKVKGIIPGLEFKKSLFSIWLGDKPADDGLKAGMIGQ